MEERKQRAVAENKKLFALLRSQRRFFESGQTLRLDFRRDILKNLRLLISENETALLEALRADLGKPYAESMLTELCPLYSEIDLALRSLTVWNAPKFTHTPFSLMPSVSKIYRHPLGCVLIFSTWNYPVQLSLLPLVSSIAAGNCTIIKLPEQSRRTAALLAELIDRYFDREYIAVLSDSFAAVNAMKRFRFDLVFFTGGQTVAKIVASAAAEKLTPTILELGGKSPCIVTKSANLRLAAKRIVFGKLLCAGQTCVAPDYLLVDPAVKDELIGYMAEYAEKFYTANQTKNRNYPKIIDRHHFARLRSCLSDGEILLGGDADPETNRISFTVMQNIRKGSKLLTDEIFGPILPVFEYSNLRAAAAFLSRRQTPLAMYIFTGEPLVREFLLRTLAFGGGCVNDTMLHMANPHLPFGGVGMSGYGRYHGKSGFCAMSSESSVLIRGANCDFGKSLRYPPYTTDMIKKLKFAFRALK